MPGDPNGSLVVPKEANVERLPDPKIEKLHKYSTVQGKLFEHDPRPDDIKQGAIGDCFLLAALNSILHRPDGSRLIQEMMKDNLDGTITVRMMRAGQPHYVRINKSIVWRFGSAMHNRGATWVSLIEKAYAAFALDGDYKSLDKGGTGDDALRVLLGGAPAAIAPSGDAAMSRLIDLSPAIPGILRVKDAELKFITETIFPEDLPSYTNANNWYTWNTKARHDELFNLFADPTLDYAKFETKLNSLGQGSLNKGTLDGVLAWARSNSSITWKDPSGRYQPRQLDFFAKVQRMLATQRAVLVSTKEKLPGIADGKGHSGGEDMVAGLVSEHTYSVADTKVEGDHRRYILVRNPWGEYGRQYTPTPSGGLTPVAAKQEAESWIELADLFKNFDRFVEGAAVLASAQAKFRTNLAQQLQDQRAKLKPTPPVNPCPSPKCMCRLFVPDPLQQNLCRNCKHTHTKPLP
jgi:hypothetical protein